MAQDREVSFYQDPDSAVDEHQRVIPFRSVPNFRDLGGYPAADGKRVKWGILYRSGHLAKMKRTDYKRFTNLNIHTLIDFRSDLEREEEPNRLPPSQPIKVVPIPVLDTVNDELVKEIYKRIEKRDFLDFDPQRKMKDMYRSFATESAEQYKQFIQEVMNAVGKPVLWHCNAGKDRAGFAAAVLLRLLGVEDEWIIADYLLSAKYADLRKKMILLLHLMRGKEIAHAVQSLLIVQKAWIQTALDAIDEHWGGFNRYRSDALAFTHQDITELRHILLEPK